MKTITFDSENADHRRHFELAFVGANSENYQFQNRDELRAHGKLLDALEGISVKDENVPAGRILKPGVQQLVLDDAWLQLNIRMCTPPNTRWLPKVTRDVEKTLEYLGAATDYVPPVALA